MARVAFFTEKLPQKIDQNREQSAGRSNDPIADFSYDLILNLADQGHDICVYSTFRANDPMPKAHPRIQILRPFKRWSWLEVPRLIPLLMQFQPEIIHIVQPRHEATRGFTNALVALPALSKFLGNPSIVTSFYDLNERGLSTHKFVLFSSDAVTVSNHSQNELMQNWLRDLGRPIGTSVLPLPAIDTTWEDSAEETEPVPESVQNFFARYRQVIFVPGDLSEHTETKSLMRLLAMALKFFPEAGVVFGGGWGEISSRERRELMHEFESSSLGGRILFLGSLSHQTEAFCIEKARVVFTASLPPESMRLMQTMRLGLKLCAVLIIGAKHQELDPIGLRDREHALILGPNPESWGPVLAQALESDELVALIRARLPDFARAMTGDQPGNAVSRIYAQLMGSRTNR